MWAGPGVKIFCIAHCAEKLQSTLCARVRSQERKIVAFFYLKSVQALFYTSGPRESLEAACYARVVSQDCLAWTKTDVKRRGEYLGSKYVKISSNSASLVVCLCFFYVQCS